MARLHRCVDRNPFDRQNEIDETVTVLRAVADLTRNPSSRNDPLCTSTEPARRLADEIALQQEFGDPRNCRLRRLGGRPRRPVARSRARERPARPRRQVQGRRAARDARADRGRRAALTARSLPHGRRRRPRGAAAAELGGAIARYEALEDRGGCARLSRSAGPRARSGAGQSAGPARISAAVHAHLRRRVPGHRSAAGGDPAAARRRRYRGDRLAPGAPGRAAGCSSSAIRSSRSTASAARTSAIYREVSQQLDAQGARLLQLQHQLPQRAGDPARASTRRSRR